jgi:peptidoglycan/LPS O-acetylase OafA/YrhL
MSNKAQEISVLQYPILNGMRGVAAIVVLCGHYALISGRNYFPSYYLAVDFFFLLSGFVISNAYQAKIDNSLSKFEFLILRIIRLTPLFLLGIFLGLLQFVIISEHGGAYSRAKLIFSMCFNVFYMPAPSSLSITPYLNFPLNSPAWSLSFEMWACVLFAFIAPKTRSLALACLAALGLIGLCFFSMKAHTANIGWSPATLGGGGI